MKKKLVINQEIMPSREGPFKEMMNYKRLGWVAE